MRPRNLNDHEDDDEEVEEGPLEELEQPLRPRHLPKSFFFLSIRFLLYVIFFLLSIRHIIFLVYVVSLVIYDSGYVTLEHVFVVCPPPELTLSLSTTATYYEAPAGDTMKHAMKRMAHSLALSHTD